MEKKFIAKCITITKNHQEFLNEEKKFKLSKFVQAKLDSYMKLKKEYKQFMTEDEKEET